MTELMRQIRKQGAEAFTHSGKFHADDVFSVALLLYLNPEIQITGATGFRKNMRKSYLTSEEENMIIIRKTAV